MKNAGRDISETAQSEVIEDEIKLVDLIYPIFKRRKFLVAFCIVSVVAVLIVSLLLKKTYEANAVLLLEVQQGSPASDLKAVFMEQFGITGLGGITGGSPSDAFLPVLKSKQVGMEVLKRINYFPLMGVGKIRVDRELAKFIGGIEVTKSKDTPTLSFTLSSDTPVLAADLANSYCVALDIFNLKDTTTSAGRLRKYVEERLEAANNELDKMQDELRKFQEKHHAISISRQAELTVTVLAELEAQRVALEVEMAAKEKFFSGPHPEIEQVKAKIEALQRNIDSLTYSKESVVPVEREKGKVEFYIPLTKIPGLNFEETKLLLQIKAKTGVVTMLTAQLEQAKLDEAKDMPTVNVLDWARPPVEPAKPKPLMNAAFSLFVSLFFGIFLIFVMEFLKRVDQDPAVSAKWQEMKQGILTKVLFFKKKKR
jgi:uncharacterized protein involved in exopolysaccharide biosynthesis